MEFEFFSILATGSLAVTVYDFSAGIDDFGSGSESFSPSNPYHVTSPLGSWPAISTDPTTDTFSDWFRDVSANFKVDRNIALTSSGNVLR